MHKKSFRLLIGCLLSVFVFAPTIALAQAQKATLFLSPASGSFELNKNFTIKVMVDSGGGNGINASDGVISFDKSKLSVANVADSGTIFKLWTTEPTFSNSNGTVSYGGGSPSAYKGASGLIFSITFKAIAAGEAKINWQSGIVLAADGKGTNVSGGMGGATITVTAAKPAEVKPTEVKPTEVKPTEPKTDADEPKGIRPPLPEIGSNSHPKTDLWYQNNRPEFSWKILSDLTGLSTSITHGKDDDPGDHADGIVEQETMEPLEDGEWYYHLKFKNRYGWGQTAHRRVLIDSTPPEAFTLSLDNEGDSTNPTPKLLFRTQDKSSGIDHYELNLGASKEMISPEQLGTGFYRLQILPPGDYRANMAAVDKAGNISSSSISFVIDALKSPIITSIPGLLDRKEQLIVQGTSFYPRVNVIIYAACNGGQPAEATVQTDDQGNWSYFHSGNLDKGTCELWAKIVDTRGAQSLDSSKHPITVVAPSLVESYGTIIIAILLILVILLLAFIFYQRWQFTAEKVRILSETREVKSKLSKIFAALREEVDELIELSDKRPGLSESERRVKEKLQESLDISEEFIAKEVDDVEKEIKLKRSAFD